MEKDRQLDHVLQAAGSVFGGFAEGERFNAEAHLLERRVRELKAAGARKAQQEKRAGKRVRAKGLADHAANDGMRDTAMLERMARIDAQMDYNVLATLYEADTAANAASMQARIAKAMQPHPRSWGWPGLWFRRCFRGRRRWRTRVAAVVVADAGCRSRDIT